MKKIALYCYSGAEPDPKGLGVALRYWADVEALTKIGYDVVKVKFLETLTKDRPDSVLLKPYRLPSTKNWIDYQVKRWIYPFYKPRELFFPQYDEQSAEGLMRIIQKYKPVILFFEHLNPWVTGAALSTSKPSFVCLHDFEDVLRFGKEASRLRKRDYNPVKNYLAIMREYWISIWLRRYSISILKKATGVLTCGKGDAVKLGKRNVNATFVPIPVVKQPDEKHLERIQNKLSGSYRRQSLVRIIHVGGLSCSHNSKGVLWFLEKSWPLLKTMVHADTYEIHFIGSTQNAPVEIMRHKDEPNLKFRGYIQELEKELAEADFAIVPPGYHTGFRTKIPESFAYGLPVVTGSYDAHGVGLTPGDPRVLIADTPEKFAGACSRLIRDATLRTRMGKLAFDTWKKDYDPEKIISETAEWLKRNIKIEN